MSNIHLFGLSESVQAEFLVTGDRYLIESGWRGAARIVTPRQFWGACRESGATLGVEPKLSV